MHKSYKYIILLFFSLHTTQTKAQDFESNIYNHTIIKNPKKAALYSAIVPGSGQFYSERYWKIPVIYSALITSAYFINKNYSQYNLYKTTYINRLDGDYSDNLIYTNNNLLTLTEHYRRNTEISTLLFTLTYILNIIDASVSAHLFEYNITDDISMNINPIKLREPNLEIICLLIKL